MAHESEDRYQSRDLEEALEKSAQELALILEDVHSADLAEWLEGLDVDEARRVLRELDAEERAELFLFAEDSTAKLLVGLLDPDQLVEIVEELPADEVVDLLALADDAKSEEVLRRVDLERAKGLRELLAYDAESAGGLMTTEYVAVSEDSNVGDAIKEIRSEEGPAGEEEVGVFVVDGEGRPVGYVSDRDLLTTKIHTPVREVMETDLILAHAEDDQEEVANQVAKYSLSALPVVDSRGVLIGVVSAEDAFEVRHEEAEEDIYRLVGASPEAPTRLPVLTRVRHRLPLQALTVLAGLATAHILDIALPGGEGRAPTTDVLRYLPIIIGLAGNVGVQSSTILVRAFATGEVSAERELSVFGTETLTGFLLGLICGAATMVVSSLMQGGGAEGLRFGCAVGVAVSVAVTWAAVLGCAVPMFCQRRGIDPAIVAGPFLIALSDISGAVIFVGVALAIGPGLGG
jgi:magnesium transporter